MEPIAMFIGTNEKYQGEEPKHIWRLKIIKTHKPGLLLKYTVFCWVNLFFTSALLLGAKGSLC
jgi:hypothetical protein